MAEAIVTVLEKLSSNLKYMSKIVDEILQFADRICVEDRTESCKSAAALSYMLLNFDNGERFLRELSQLEQSLAIIKEAIEKYRNKTSSSESANRPKR